MLPDDVWPVSVNDHFVEPAGLWLDRLPRRRAADAPQVVELDGGAQAWRFGPELVPLSVVLGAPLFRRDVKVPVTRIDHIAPAANETGARVASMDRAKVAVHTLLPHICGFTGERLRQMGDPGLWADCIRAYNDFVLGEFCAAAPDRLVALALLPLADQTATVAEIERVAALGARGISLPHDPGNLGLDSYHRPSWARIFDAADAAGLPVFIHIASSGTSNAGSLAGWPSPDQPRYRPPEVQVAAANLHVLEAACDLAFSPLLTERPNRRVVLLEGNLSWMPYLEERLDFATHGRPAIAPKGRPAGQVMHDQILGAFISDPHGIRDRHLIGLDRFFWMGDYPHPDGFWPDDRSRLAAELSAVPNEEARQIAEGNARKLLKLAAWTPPVESGS